MYIFKFLLIFIFIFSCNTEPVRKEIIVGKTIKIEASNFGDKNLSNNYNFLWSLPSSPNNSGSDMSFKIENNKMLFTPYYQGNYDIVLTIENINNTSLYEEIFSYFAYNDGTYEHNINRDTDIGLNIKPTSNINIKRYTIQVAAKPTIEKAKNYQAELREKGFDAYTESLYKDNKQIWRVRVGNFSNYDKGKLIEKELQSLGYDTWFTIIKE